MIPVPTPRTDVPPVVDAGARARRAVRLVRRHVRRGLAELDAPAVLAVSGGRDSMVLLDAACAVACDRIAAVAVFDHGTGPHAPAAVRLVRRVARRRGLRVVVGRAALAGAGEARWRDARWRFLRAVAARVGAGAIVTAHSADDQLETVAIRLLRGAGARGLAGLLADAPDVRRPLVGVRRATVAAYAEARRLRWIEDPGNADPRFLRVRLRHELLPALERVRPGFGASLLAVGRAAATWRREVEALAVTLPARIDASGALHVATAGLEGYDAEALAVLWPALAARAGVRLDRRGTARLVRFTIDVAAEAAAVGAAIQVAGGAEVVVRRGSRVPGAAPAGVRGSTALVLRRASASARSAVEVEGPLPLVGEVRLGAWRFRPLAGPCAADDLWSAWLPADGAFAVRGWRPGDRIRRRAAGAGRDDPSVAPGTARRVKRFLAEAGIPGPERAGWPVVLATPGRAGTVDASTGAQRGGELVWVPGVCRTDAATVRPELPGVCYGCERIEPR